MDLNVTQNPQDRERALDVWLGLTGQAPLPSGPMVLPVLSGSMRPSIPLGSRILIESRGPGKCRIGEVTVYLDGDRLVAHRLLWRAGSRFFFKGDANSFGHWIPGSRIRGVVKEVLPSDDVAAAFPGKDPFSLEAVRQSRREYLRNLVLAMPRWLRDALTGKLNKEKDEPR